MARRHGPLPPAPARRGRRLSVSRAGRASPRTGRRIRSARSRRRARAVRRTRTGRIPGDGPPAPVAQAIERLEGRLDHPARVVAGDPRQRARDRGAGDVDRDERRGPGGTSGRDRVIGGVVEGSQDERDIAAVDGGRGLHVGPQDRAIRPGRRLDEPERVFREERPPHRDLGDRARPGSCLVGQPRRQCPDDDLVRCHPVSPGERHAQELQGERPARPGRRIGRRRPTTGPARPRAARARR